MKHITNEAYEKIQKVLSTAFLQKENMAFNDNWRMKVMGRIRTSELYPNISYAELLQRLVWKLSPVSIAIAIIFLFVIAQIDFVSDYEIARILVEDPIEYSLFTP